MNDFDAERIMEARNALGPILDVLRGRGRLWHRTSVSSLRAILESSGIEPNLGQFEVTYPQSRSSHGRNLQAVSLFDFDTEPLDEILIQSINWRPFLIDRGDATVVVQLDRNKLDHSKLVLPPTIRGKNMPVQKNEAGEEYVPTFIPRVEAWYCGVVPCSSFVGYMLVKGRKPFQFCELAHSSGVLDQIQKIESEWMSEPEELRPIDILSPPRDLELEIEQARKRVREYLECKSE